MSGCPARLQGHDSEDKVGGIISAKEVPTDKGGFRGVNNTYAGEEQVPTDDELTPTPEPEPAEHVGDLMPEPEPEPDAELAQAFIDMEAKLDEASQESEPEPESENEQVMELEIVSEPEPEPEPESANEIEPDPAPDSEAELESLPDFTEPGTLEAQDDAFGEAEPLEFTEIPMDIPLPDALEDDEVHS